MQENPPNPNKSGFEKWRMARLAFEMGFIIALPIVTLGLLGKYLDQRLNTGPGLTLAAIGLAIILTTAWLTKKFKQYLKP